MSHTVRHPLTRDGGLNNITKVKQMNKATLLICAACLAIISVGCSNPQRHSGTYQGTCHNLTYGGQANLVLTAIVNQDGVVTGNINITGELQGSSAIQGLVEGKNMTFTSNQKGSGFTITWRGSISGDTIQGGYLVSANDIHKILGTDDQQGEWSVSRMK